MKTLIFSILAIFIFSQSYAQLDKRTSPSGFGNTYNTYKIKSSSKNEIKGSPYLNETFALGEVYTKDGKLYKDMQLRYNIISDEIEFINEEEIQAVKSRDITVYAIIGSDTLVTKKYSDSGNMEYGHFIQLVSGKTQLLVKKRKHFVEGTEEQAYQEAKNPAYVDKADEFYLSNSDDIVAKKVPKKKEISVFFGDKETEITSYIKQEKISLRKQSDLANLVKYYNSIQ